MAGVFLLQCDRHPSGEASASREATSGEASRPLAVSSDMAWLRSVVRLPEGATGCRWVEERKGDGFLGPSDYFITAYVDLSPAGWAQLLGSDARAPMADAGSSVSHVDAALARGLLPQRLLAGVADAGRTLDLPSQDLPRDAVRSTSVFYVASVVRIGDGLWIDLGTQ